MFDLDAFEERAAIMEFDGGMTRFKAETEAARLQGLERWQALKFVKEATDANGSGHSQRGGNTDPALAGQRGSGSVSRMQPAPQEENRPMPQRYAQA